VPGDWRFLDPFGGRQDVDLDHLRVQPMTAGSGTPPVFVSISQEPLDDYEDTALPTAFTCHRLDAHEAQAVIAAQDLDGVLGDLSDVRGQVDFYEYCLRSSAQHSTRAARAQAALLRAHAAVDAAWDAIEEARAAFTRGWGDPEDPHRAGHGPHPPPPCAAMTRSERDRITDQHAATPFTLPRELLPPAGPSCQPNAAPLDRLPPTVRARKPPG
jgi:hypothetical protein